MPTRSSLRSTLAVASALGLPLLLGQPAAADNSPDGALKRVEQHYLPKVQHACGITLSVEYDVASLRAHNDDILHDQTDGQLSCGEPLRYLWYACQSPAGRSAVQKAAIARIVCKGAEGKTGSLNLTKGTLTVERADEERDPHERLRPRFEALLHVTLSFPDKANKDPYRDRNWDDLQYQPNPTNNTRDYCIVGGKKQEFDRLIVNKAQPEGARVQCWKDGEPVIDLAYKSGKRTGFYTEWSTRGSRRFSYLDGDRHGEEKNFEGERLESVVMYERGKRVWSKEFHPSGKLARYARNLGKGSASISQGEDGKVYGLVCAPEVGSDPLLRGPCGFEGQRATTVYDGTEKVDRIETWRNGVLLEQGAGTSEYSERSNVKFVEGKKHGLERVLDDKGKLSATISWNRGVKDGKESEYAEGGTKTVKEIVWKAGEVAQLTEFYLNGKPKLKEVHDKPEHKQVEGYWDTGKLRQQGGHVLCSRYGVRDWCADGEHRSFYEDGKPSTVETYAQGQEHGPQKSWWPNGKLQAEELYIEGKRAKSKRWDAQGKLSADEEYEADGSRKLK